ncbi:hypothetical protein CWI38_0638p0050 [Hamiltosporidium tvaerminnensis]|uniref:Uncharacterized protein n=2 Tax=Hamiltosporidium TaxID=1176354 RepID=A0A4Q9LYG6_9MICR|nr:hypothetical protein LUQ84_002575 [Hamiltosporidium tvaerminnensis]TBU00922.1 hypothetical protein CWI37_0859p0030 [Hamiltosporidium tvaerminnensis]TBU06192.1 hypothetical protein CWI36_0495p0010 [Hamiltosporidium magnivora]TBU12765.1 hypothetical protein CWI38_0638p0050 [Hamiltosporidium tvaerminnensis]
MKKDVKENRTVEDNKTKRYNQTEVYKTFLSSNNGISFIIDKAKEVSRKNKESNGRYEGLGLNGEKIRSKEELYKSVENIVDFYLTWVSLCPGRKFLKMNKYDFLCEIENFCSKSEIKKFFSYLFV